MTHTREWPGLPAAMQEKRIATERLVSDALKTAAERDRLREINAELVECLKAARECIAYCRRTHPDPQSGTGMPIEVFIDAAIAKATDNG